MSRERDWQPRNYQEMPAQGDRYGNNPPNYGSARSDYGELAYGGGLNREGLDRGWWDRTSDEVSSWFGDEEAERRRRMDEQRDASRNRDYWRPEDRGYPLGFTQSESPNRGSDRYVQDWHRTPAHVVMTRDVATVHPDDAVQYAARMMADCDCGAVPVVDWQGRLIGMITDRDITVRLVARNVNVAQARVGDCMTERAFACHVDEPLENCMRQMSRHQIRRIPIVDDRNRVVGIISQGDLAHHASENRGMGERRAISDVVCAISEPSRRSYR